MRNSARMSLLLLVFFLILPGCKGKNEQPAPPRQSGSFDLNVFKEAETLKRILEKDPGNVMALIRLGNIYFDTGQNEEAVETYRKALELDPENADVRTDMGICLRKLKRTDEAVASFKRAIRSNPRHYQSRYNLGLVLLHEKNDLRGAVAVWEDLIKEVPAFPGRDRLAEQVEHLKQTGQP